MPITHYPLAVPADRLVADIQERRHADPASNFGYECLFFATGSTRPAMAFELFPEVLSSPDWQAHVVETMTQAKNDARDGEAVYFEPYGDNVS